ncbi:hypothetical protein V6N12_075136 [Hibiscus sabdariffa]|uniref:Uncharacterized protein n=1 Tax=Hibiscus sabdariffa TaxID=183260 RepID=A0ABR2BZQ9_9ROSI
MCPLSKDVSQTGNVKTLESAGTIFEADDPNILRSLERPRAINVERNRSPEERIDHFEGLSPHGRRSGFNTPRSYTCLETHVVVTEAWKNLRHSTVYYRSQPVGTIAAMDHSVEELNYDQCFGLFDERGGRDSEEFSIENSSFTVMGKKDRPVQARGRSDAGKFQSDPQPRNQR